MPKEHRKNKRKSTYNKHTRRKPGELYDLNKKQGEKNTKYKKRSNPNKKSE